MTPESLPVPPESELSAAIQQVLQASPKPLKFSEIKKQLQQGGVTIPGTKKEHDPAIRQALSHLTANHSAYATGPEGKETYSTSPPPTPLRKRLLSLLTDPIPLSSNEIGNKLDPKPKPAELKTVLLELTSEAKLHVHGVGKALKYSTVPPPPPPPPIAEQILAQFKNRESVTLTDLNQVLLGNPPKKLVTDAIKKLIAEKQLFPLGTGKNLRYTNTPPPKPKWYELPPFKKDYDSLLKSVENLLNKHQRSFDEILAAVMEKFQPTVAKVEPSSTTAPPVTDPDPVKKPEPEPEDTGTKDLRTVLKEAYDELCLYTEFKHDKLVTIPRLYHETKKTIPNLDISRFHDELWKLAGNNTLQLHILNEIHKASEPNLAINRDDRLFYFILWK